MKSSVATASAGRGVDRLRQHRPSLLTVLFLFLFLFTMAAESRSPRRNRNRVKMRNAQTATEREQDGVCELEVTCSGGQRFPVSLPVKKAKLPVEKPTRSTVVKDTATERPVDAINTSHRVAFFAGLSKNVGPVSSNSDLVFDKIITNVGDALSQESGRFTAPHDGTYVFSVTIAAQGKQRAAVELSLNGRMVATIWAESIPFWASASNTAILNLQKGDQVWLILLSRASFLHGYMYSTFSGHCLYYGV
ncbi:complement c1q tumor necrosis factor-related protein 6 [Plakobranchus ocellatus]|uniref:Complement c1q tumor necrosis factor-related protein 6 n=1 Tax=Plakobranchus ocellatus TaxID=259542 RepID=A0AAV4CF61_9GAST|nr:complement c1q tumor necrosis factor-related protein 6 [Plakobranchus ocellatus]